MGNTITVMLECGELQSRSKADVLNYANAAVVGNEIIQFTKAELIDKDVYKLSGLLRGRNGTEHYVDSHAIGDRFVLLDVKSLITVPIGNVDWYKELDYRIGPKGESVLNDDYKNYKFVPNGNMYQPWSVCHVKSSRDELGNIKINWIRRTRKEGAWKDYSDAPLSENLEAYDVEFLALEGIVKRTIGITKPEVIYSEAMQMEDFGNTQAKLLVRIYQISEVRGRGIMKEVII